MPKCGGCSGPAPAVQLYTLRDALARDVRAALRALREIGIVEAELYGLNGPENATLFGLPAGDLKRALDENDIRVSMAHVGVPYDYLMSHTDSNLVKIELDVGWLAAAGVDPVAYLRRYSGRVIACHLKDYDASIASEVPQVPPGSGTIDFAAVLAAMNDTGVTHGFIEVDVSDDPLGDVRRGHAHLQTLKGCA